jgi:phosphatidylserine decarboxylase
MKLAPEGNPQMIASTVLLGAATALLALYFQPAAIIPFAVWIWSIAFFRDPDRSTTAAPNEFCAPADGTITDITRLESCDGFDIPVIRIGIFLSLFNVHINRAACAGTVRKTFYQPGKCLAAYHKDTPDLNESNTLWIDPEPPITGPIAIRQIVGVAARRIICHAAEGTRLAAGQRFGLIKFGSRTELILPDLQNLEILAIMGLKVTAGETILARQRVASHSESGHGADRRIHDEQ